MTIETVKPEDAGELLSVYAPYVKNTAVSLEYDVPTVKEFRKRIETTVKDYPYIKAVENGRILGYAYAHRFRERKAYDYAAETSVYVSENACGGGIGTALYRELEKRLKEKGIRKMYAYIVACRREDEHLTERSIFFHEKTGFRRIGEARDIGVKFGKNYDVLWYEKDV